MKTVSVIIPTYKNRGGLLKSVDSALSQDYPGLLEVIIVDDNEPDSEDRRSTITMMQKYSDNPKVVYICHDRNKNGAAARNTGINASKGDFIAFLDDDDLFLEGKLTKQVEYLEKHLENKAVYCLARRCKYCVPQDVIEGNGTREILMLKSNFFTPSLMFYREALISINGFDETFRRHQDYELLLRFFAAGFNIGCVPEVLIEIGSNQGENILSGEKIDELKAYFFSKFKAFIEKEDEKTPGFLNEVYANHYAGVFLSHIKTRNFRRAFRTFNKYFFKSPLAFSLIIYKHAKIHLTKSSIKK